MRVCLLSLIIVFTSCEMVVNFDVPFEKPDIVVNAIINPDSVFTIELSESAFILDNKFGNANFPAILNADIKVFANGNELNTPFHLNNGVYVIQNYYPQPGVKYEIRVNIEGYDEVSVTDKIPPEEASFELKDFVLSEGEYDEIIPRFNLIINDQPGSNYYEFRVFGEQILYDYSTDPPTPMDTTLLPITLTSDDPVISDIFDEYYGDKILFNDKLYDGKNYSLPVSMNYFPYYPEDNNSQQEIRLIISLKNVSEAYFNYNISLELQQQTDGDPFTEPVPVFSNVENGLGIMGSYIGKSELKIIDL